MTFAAPESTSPSRRKLWIAITVLIVAGLLVAGGFIMFVVKFGAGKTYYAPSPSMAPAIKQNDRFRTTEVDDKTKIQRGWIVIFDNPNIANEPTLKNLVKRVVALPGDTVSESNGKLYVNGKPADEPYLAADTITNGLALMTVPAGSYYVLGDNRTNSFDSRRFGPVSADAIHRRAVEVIWPWSHRHKL
jgi:signal peptidase I